MINNRRDFLKQSLMNAGLLAFANGSSLAAEPNKPPMRFIFMHRGNGLWPRVCVPPSFNSKTLEKENRKNPIDIDLDAHDLPGWMDPLSEHKEKVDMYQHSWVSGTFAGKKIFTLLWVFSDTIGSWSCWFYFICG